MHAILLATVLFSLATVAHGDYLFAPARDGLLAQPAGDAGVGGRGDDPYAQAVAGVTDGGGDNLLAPPTVDATGGGGENRLAQPAVDAASGGGGNPLSRPAVSANGGGGGNPLAQPTVSAKPLARPAVGAAGGRGGNPLSRPVVGAVGGRGDQKPLTQSGVGAPDGGGGNPLSRPAVGATGGGGGNPFAQPAVGAGGSKGDKPFAQLVVAAKTLARPTVGATSDGGGKPLPRPAVGATGGRGGNPLPEPAVGAIGKRSNAPLVPKVITADRDDAVSGSSHTLKTYLIIVCRANGPKESGEKLREWHASLLASLLNTTTEELLRDAQDAISAIERPRLIYSFAHVVSGFAARLTNRELKEISRLPWCVEALPDASYRLTTTYTPALLGVSTPGTGAWSVGRSMGEGVVVAVLDNGIDPRHASFLDDGMPPPPPKWRGRCDFGGAPCNNKLIGGQSRAPQDHGMHTSSTAVGAFVRNTKVYNTNIGTASGMAPRAHLAFYEVCVEDTCSSTEILTETEKGAFQDGVDVISISAGDDTQKPFYQDLIAVGSFSAVMSGVFVSTSAGNAGPIDLTVTNCAPWLLTAAASTMGRRIVSKVELGNGVVLHGETRNPYKRVKNRPLVYVAGMFEDGALNGVDVRGKIVACDRMEDPVLRAEMIEKAGGVGMISWSGVKRGGATTPVDNITIASSRVPHGDGAKVMAYINSTAKPTATLRFAGVQLNTSSRPAIADYSSRGPCNVSNVGVIKPDITGPGTNIVAAVPGPGSGNIGAPTRAFDTHSGTSMSAPHLSGIVAMLKRARPGWSPAMIKSAMMTTADVTHPDGTPITDETTGRPASVFAMGAGLVNPTRALDPGLVYNLTQQDYILYVCGLGYNETFVNDIIAQPVQNVSCDKTRKIDGKDLNYPSIMVTLPPGAPAVEVRRAVTNVGDAAEVYVAEVVAPEGVAVEVVPDKLAFASLLQRMEFIVKFRRSADAAANGAAEGSLRWVSGKRSVRSPIAVLFQPLSN